MADIPGFDKSPLLERKSTIEIVGAAAPFCTAVVTGSANLLNPGAVHWIGITALAGAGFIASSAILKYRLAAKEEKLNGASKHDGLYALACAIHQVIQSRCKEAGNGLRMTVFRVVAAENPDDHPEWLEQLIPYAGAKGGKAGRRFSIRSGIIGQAVRDRTPVNACRAKDDYNEFIKDMVKNWSYTHAEARQLSPDRFAWLAIPILGKDNQDVVAVVFLDSPQRNIFNRARQSFIIDTCKGIAVYMQEHYL